MIATWIEATLAARTAPDAVVIVRERHQLNLRWALNTLTTNGTMAEREATVIAIDGERATTASGSATSLDELLVLLARAEKALAEADASPDAMPLPEGFREASFSEPAEDIALDALAHVTAGLGEAFADARSRDIVLFGFAELHRTTTWLATSAGVRRRVVEPMGRFEFTAKSLDFINSAWVGQETRNFADIDVCARYAELVKRIGWGKNRIELEPGRYETILSPGAVVDLMLPMMWDFSARDAAEGQSVFSGKDGATRVGERFSSLPVTLSTDPDEPGLEVADVVIAGVPQPGVVSLFDNGAPVERVEWFTDGTLAQLARHRRSMADAGMDGVLPFSADNLVMSGGEASLDEMIATTKRGLLVTCLWYIRDVDPQTKMLTGLTRDGVYVIDNGQVIGAANNFRWNESPVSVLGRMTEMSQPMHCLCREWNDWFTKSIVPAIRVPDFLMSTVSKAV